MQPQGDNTTTPRKPQLRRAAVAVGLIALAVIAMQQVLNSRCQSMAAREPIDSLNAALRICDRQIDSLLALGDADDDAGDIPHRQAVMLLRRCDSLAAAGATAEVDSDIVNRLLLSLVRDTAILNAKVELFADMPRLHADLADRRLHTSMALDYIENRK